MRGVQNPTAEQFEVAYRHHRGTIFAYVYTATRHRATAEDLTSETFVRALGAAHRFTDRGGTIGAWLMTIARNLVRDHFKSCDVRNRSPLTVAPERASGEPGPERLLLRRQLAVALTSSLTQLTAAQRRCVELRFYQGLTVRETAARMHKSEPTVRQLQHRAVRCLGDHVGRSWLGSIQ